MKKLALIFFLISTNNTQKMKVDEVRKSEFLMIIENSIINVCGITDTFCN